jgi:hypothetical protein
MMLRAEFPVQRKSTLQAGFIVARFRQQQVEAGGQQRALLARVGWIVDRSGLQLAPPVAQGLPIA